MYMDWEARSQWYKLRARATCAPGGLLAKPTVGVMLNNAAKYWSDRAGRSFGAV